MSPSADHDVSVEFLKRWKPGGMWVLTAVTTDRKSIETKTFTDPDPMRKWIAKHNKKRNVYFHVNSVRRALDKKAEREQIKTLDWLHVDFDTRTLVDFTTDPDTQARLTELSDFFAEEKTRLHKLAFNPPTGIPQPTVIIDSGGGYQCFWKLDAPVSIEGVKEKYEDVKRYNQQLEVAYQGDHCHNIDRIMRIPGTINWPDKRKQKKGRSAVVARLLEWNDNIYPLGKFTQAPLIQMVSATQSSDAQAIRVSGDIERLADVDELPKKVCDLCKVVIVQGTDPDKPERYESRSEALFFVCCELKRAKCDDQLIYSIITDPDYRISDSVLDKGSNAEAYAIKQIRRANEEAIDKELREMNDKHMVIADISERCVIASETFDDVSGYNLISYQTFDHFRNRYMHIMKQIGEKRDGDPVFMPLGDWWLKQRERRQYKTIVFKPGQVIPDVYNLWQGFRCQALAGDCSLFLEHIRDHICAGNDEYYNYLMGWMARAVQFPGRPGEVAVILRGGMGTGKSFFAKQFGYIFGRHFTTVSDSKHLFGNFNAHLRECVLLLGDEAFYAGDKRQASSLKRTITDDTIMIESKGVNVRQSHNCIHLIMASNEYWVVPAGADERRFFILDVGEHSKVQDVVYFGLIEKQLKGGGYEALLHMLLNYDITDYEVREVPQTTALRDQKMLSLTPEHDWWYTRLLEGNITIDAEGWEDEVAVMHLVVDFQKHNRSMNIPAKTSATRLRRFFESIFPAKQHRPIQHRAQLVTTDVNGREVIYPRPYYYTIPTLEKCREKWEKLFRTEIDWPDESEDEEIPKKLSF